MNSTMDLEGLNERLRENLHALFKRVGRGGECKACNAPVYFVPHMNSPLMGGKRVHGIYDPDGTSHFATCTKPGLFRMQQQQDKERKR